MGLPLVTVVLDNAGYMMYVKARCSFFSFLFLFCFLFFSYLLFSFWVFSLGCVAQALMTILASLCYKPDWRTAFNLGPADGSPTSSFVRQLIALSSCGASFSPTFGESASHLQQS